MDQEPSRKGWVGAIGAAALIIVLVLIWQLSRTGGPAVAVPSGQATPGTQPVN